MSRPEFSNDRLGILHGITIDDAPPPPKRSKRKSEPHHTRSSSRHRSHSPSTSEPRKSKFRFKKKHSSRHSDRPTTSSSSSKRPKHGYHAPLVDDPTEYDDTYIPNVASWSHAKDPDAAFRESLFDAMADDEGAAFWEGVYGQPIHVYSRPGLKDERGELEQMGDEEYASYVREKMWEKSHEHIMEERARREKEKERRKQSEEEEREEWEREERERRVKEKVRRERRGEENMRRRWGEYAGYWETQKGVGDPGDIPWPVGTGKARDVTKEAVEEFILAAPKERMGLQDVIKAERVRWHPDKAQQRWGREALTETEMRAITTVFQTVDGLWREREER